VRLSCETAQCRLRAGSLLRRQFSEAERARKRERLGALCIGDLNYQLCCLEQLLHQFVRSPRTRPTLLKRSGPPSVWYSKAAALWV
jgi:hypothetical protein